MHHSVKSDQATQQLCSVQVAFQGTVVTIENFLAWKATFDLEMTELRRRKQKEEELGSKSKLTGEKWYLISGSLDHLMSDKQHFNQSKEKTTVFLSPF